MNIHEILWLPQFEEKIWVKHRILPLEVEELLFGRPRVFFAEKGSKQGEDVFAAYGQTLSGRYLSVFFVLKADGAALILSARDMDRKERKRYGKKQ